MNLIPLYQYNFFVTFYCIAKINHPVLIDIMPASIILNLSLIFEVETIFKPINRPLSIVIVYHYRLQIFCLYSWF